MLLFLTVLVNYGGGDYDVIRHTLTEQGDSADFSMVYILTLV